jgi:hypothetical protein
MLVGGLLAVPLDISCSLQSVSQRVALAAGTSAAMLLILALLIVSISPGHVNIG